MTNLGRLACPLALACCALSTSGQGQKPMGSQASPDTIHVSSGSYGLNCANNTAGNGTDILKGECDGKESCSFEVSKVASHTGDPCGGTAKTFDYVYVCGNRELKGIVSPEANGKTAFLSCQTISVKLMKKK